MFGEKLKQIRNERKVKQSELASILGVGNSTISNWENNTSRPDVDTIALICGALNISPNYFFDVPANMSVIKKTPPALECEEEYTDEDFETAAKLYEAFLSAGLIKEGQDLTDRQVDFLDGLCSIIRAFFSGSDQ